ncbi:MAG: alpha/beta hydrolase [Actinobacteria bacterium]|nr:alpha/beta hydrolase [Actinomycetota bacterium]MBL7124143.1 alpha/beta hydrolase [Actinomycetota bacterium]
MIYLRIIYIFLAILAGIIIIYFSFAVYLFLNQSKYVYYPTKEIISNPSYLGLEYEDIFFKTSDNISLNGWYIPVENSKGIILIFHGNGGNISNRLELIDMFYKIELTTFIFDYRGYGRSEGEPSEGGTYLDAEAAWNYLVSERKIKPGNIILYGRSLGGPVASWLAKENKPEALIIDSTFTSIKDIAEKLYPYFPVRRFFKFDYPTVDYLKKVNCPILVIHSRSDNYIPFSHAMKLYDEANTPKEFLEIMGDHNSSLILSKDIYMEGIDSFILKY